MCISARYLSACLFHVSASGAIIAAATANSRRLSQQNPYKTWVSSVELGRTSRHFIVHFEKIPTKKFPRYGRCAEFSGMAYCCEVQRYTWYTVCYRRHGVYTAVRCRAIPSNLQQFGHGVIRYSEALLVLVYSRGLVLANGITGTLLPGYRIILAVRHYL